MSCFNICNVTEVNTFICLTDDGKIGEILWRPALILTANFARTIILSNQPRRQILAFRIDPVCELIKPDPQALHLFGGKFDLQLLFG